MVSDRWIESRFSRIVENDSIRGSHRGTRGRLEGGDKKGETIMIVCCHGHNLLRGGSLGARRGRARAEKNAVGPARDRGSRGYRDSRTHRCARYCSTIGPSSSLSARRRRRRQRRRQIMVSGRRAAMLEAAHELT